MTLIIKRDPDPPKLIVIGGAKPTPVPDPPPVPVKNERGRKKMTEEKKLDHETGVKKISEQDAGTQGAIGSGGVNAPAQEKVPDEPKGDKDNG